MKKIIISLLLIGLSALPGIAGVRSDTRPLHSELRELRTLESLIPVEPKGATVEQRRLLWRGIIIQAALVPDKYPDDQEAWAAVAIGLRRWRQYHATHGGGLETLNRGTSSGPAADLEFEKAVATLSGHVRRAIDHGAAEPFVMAYLASFRCGILHREFMRQAQTGADAAALKAIAEEARELIQVVGRGTSAPDVTDWGKRIGRPRIENSVAEYASMLRHLGDDQLLENELKRLSSSPSASLGSYAVKELAAEPERRQRRDLAAAELKAAELLPDGPYIVAQNDESGQHWKLLRLKRGGAVEKQSFDFGDPIAIDAGGGRPAFEFQVRFASSSSAPDRAEWPVEKSVFVLADTHGEFQVATELLIKQGVIDEKLRWNFGQGHLVVLGDVLDRGLQQTELMWLLYKLEAEAAASGGRVRFVLGNHETMVLTGGLSYLHPRYARVAMLLGAESYSELWGRDTILGRWLRTKPTIFQMGNVLFLHGGISAQTVRDDLSVEEINEMVRAWLNDDRSSDSGRLAAVTGRNGPLWYRGLVKKDAKPEEVEAIKKIYGVERVAVGHTVVPTVTPLYNGSVIAVQVYPTKDKTTGKMNMEGVYIDEQGTWHKAKIDGTREILRDDAGNPIRNGVPTPAAGAPGSPSPEATPAAESTETPAEPKKAA